LGCSGGLHGDQHAHTAFALWNMGAALLHQGKLEEALAELRQTLRIQEQLLAHKHEGVARTLKGITVVHDVQGKLPEALEGYTEVPRIRKMRLGGEHSEVGGALMNIASVHYLQDVYSEALSGFKEALRIQTNTLGEAHREVGATLNGITALRAFSKSRASTQRNTRRSERRLASRSRGSGRSIWGLPRCSINWGHTLRMLSGCSQDARRARGGTQALGQALKIYCKVLREESREVAHVRGSVWRTRTQRRAHILSVYSIKTHTMTGFSAGHEAGEGAVRG